MEKNTYTTLLYEVILLVYMWGLRGRYFLTEKTEKFHPFIRASTKNQPVEPFLKQICLWSMPCNMNMAKSALTRQLSRAF